MSLVDSVDAGASRPRGTEPLPAGASQEPAGTTEKTFPLGKYALWRQSGPSVGDWWPPGLFLLPGCPSLCVYSSTPGSWVTLGCHHGIRVAGQTHLLKTKQVRKECPPYTLATCAE